MRSVSERGDGLVVRDMFALHYSECRKCSVVVKGFPDMARKVHAAFGGDWSQYRLESPMFRIEVSLISS
jgi:hypothetical protein